MKAKILLLFLALALTTGCTMLKKEVKELPTEKPNIQEEQKDDKEPLQGGEVKETEKTDESTDLRGSRTNPVEFCKNQGGLKYCYNSYPSCYNELTHYCCEFYNKLGQRKGKVLLKGTECTAD